MVGWPRRLSDLWGFTSLSEQAVGARRRPFRPDVVVVLVVAVRDQLPAVDGGDAGAVAGDARLAEQDRGARAVRQDAAARIADRRGAFDHDEGGAFAGGGEGGDAVAGVARHGAVAQDDMGSA